MATLALHEGSAEAKLMLSPLLGDHMVLPVHEGRVVVEGRANPHELIEAALGERTTRARADGQGRWRLTWPATLASSGSTKLGPTTLRFTGPDGFFFRDVLLGEVWLAAGQSNMAMPTRKAEGGDELASEAATVDLRFFRLENETEDDLRGVRGHWARASLGEAARFSAVATAFGLALQRGQHHAVGLVQAAWNATPIEAWIREQAWTATGHGDLRPPSVPKPSAQAERDFESKRRAWARAARFRDPGDAGFGRGWAEPGFDDHDWRSIQVPGSFESQGLALDGVVWLRRNLSLPSTCVGRALSLSLGPIDDCDRTFINGVLVGSTCHEVEDPYRISRNYRVPASIVTSTTLVLAVRVVDEIGDGGFTGLPAELELNCDASPDAARPEQSLPLAGAWHLRVEEEAPRDRPGLEQSPAPPPGWPTPATPGILARHWIARLAPFALTGVLWYQGENNLGQPERYPLSLEVWLGDWSAIFERSDLPVLLVQLPGHQGATAAAPAAEERRWAKIREAQRRLSRHTQLAPHGQHANVRLVVITDLGQGREMHPARKRPIGERAAWLALHERAPATGPWFRALARTAGGARLDFDAEGPLRSAGEQPLRGFRVVDEQGHEEPCLPVPHGQSVELPFPSGKKVVAIRYAFADQPDGTLTDDTGWPASPFEIQVEGDVGGK